MLELLLLPLAGVMILFLAVATLTLKATGRPLWNEDISRTAKGIWSTGFVVALTIALLLLGPLALLATWPFWIGVVVFTFGVFGGLDWLHARRKRKTTPTVGAPRVIQLQDGRFVMVDQAEGLRWQFLDAPGPGATDRPAPRPRSLKRRVADWLLEE